MNREQFARLFPLGSHLCRELYIETFQPTDSEPCLKYVQAVAGTLSRAWMSVSCS